MTEPAHPECLADYWREHIEEKWPRLFEQLTRFYKWIPYL